MNCKWTNEVFEKQRKTDKSSLNGEKRRTFSRHNPKKQDLKKKELTDKTVNKPDPRVQATQLRPLKCPFQSLDL